jgi:serine/arginine repetitive matrix protein 2
LNVSVLSFSFFLSGKGDFFVDWIFCYLELKELQQTCWMCKVASSSRVSILSAYGWAPSNATNDVARVFLQSQSEEISQVQAERDQQAQAQQEQQSSQCNELLSAFYTLNTKYWISWECAELLIQLAGGVSSSTRTAS